MRSFLLCVATLIAALAGCAGDTGPEPDGAFTITDSAGIEIVVSHQPLWAEGEGWTVDPEPLLDIGGDPGPEDDFNGIQAAIRLDDGRIVVANLRPPELMVFSSSGAFAGKIGRLGDGPGEFRSIQLFRMEGDTLAVYDDQLARITFLTPEGEVVGIQPARPPGRYRRRFPVAVLPGRRVLERGLDYSEAPPTMGPFETPGAIDILEPDGTRTELPHPVYGRESEIVAVEPQPLQVEPLFWRWTDVVYRAEGSGRPGDIVTSWNHHAQAEVLDLEGHVRRIIRWEVELELVTDATVQERENLLAEARGREPEPGKSLDEVTNFYPTLPAHGGLIADREGNLWFAEYDLIRMEGWRRYAVLEREGRWLGEVKMPDGLQAHEIGADYVLGVWRDELDVQHVRLHRLAMPEGRY